MDNYNNGNCSNQYQDPNANENGYGTYNGSNNNNGYNNYNGYGNPNGQQYNDEKSRPLTMGEWIVMILVPMIPCVGIILYFVWAFSSNTNVNRRNFCRANIVVFAVLAAIYAIAIFFMGSAFSGMM